MEKPTIADNNPKVVALDSWKTFAWCNGSDKDSNITVEYSLVES